MDKCYTPRVLIYCVQTQHTRSRGSSDEEELRLEFGSEVSLFTPHTLHLLVTNTTAIPTTLSTSLSSFPPSHPHLPTPPPPPPHRSRKKYACSSNTYMGL